VIETLPPGLKTRFPVVDHVPLNTMERSKLCPLANTTLPSPKVENVAVVPTGPTKFKSVCR
jgi:hypothetical protein